MQCLIYYDLLMPYGEIDLGQHWLGWWLVARQHQTITRIISKVQHLSRGNSLSHQSLKLAWILFIRNVIQISQGLISYQFSYHGISKHHNVTDKSFNLILFSRPYWLRNRQISTIWSSRYLHRLRKDRHWTKLTLSSASIATDISLRVLEDIICNRYQFSKDYYQNIALFTHRLHG